MKKRTPCAHAEIKPDARGRIIIRANKAFRCLTPEPDLPTLPASITKAYGFKWPPPRNYVMKDDCAECPCWTPREGGDA